MRIAPRLSRILLPLLAFAAAPAVSPAQVATTPLARQVEAAERAFARSFADRDHAAFTRHLADDAVFFAEDAVMRGKAAVADGWRPMFDGQAPFSWEPDLVEVVESGSLALTSGIVRNPDGQVVGRFNSVWRQESPGVWRVVFDRGQPICPG